MNGCHAPGGRPAWPHTAVLALLLLLASALCAETLTTENARDRIAALRSEIARHDELYFRRAHPEITDAAYDALKRELDALERTHPGAAADLAPLPALGDDHTEGFSRVPHRAPMRGLAKTHTEAELRAWHTALAARLGRSDFPIVLEPKIDGVACSATYEHGVLVRVLTRGDGAAGDDITATARRIPTLPARLSVSEAHGAKTPLPELIELRGEIHVPPAEFARLNRARESAGEAPSAHPRNLAAGILKQLAPEESEVRALAITFFGWGACEPVALVPTSQGDFHTRARLWGLPVLAPHTTAVGAGPLWLAVRTLERERHRLPYPTDGAVAKIDAGPLRARLGEEPGAPRWATAYKFAVERATTRLRAITVQVGRSGRLTPVAELEPVRLAGANIARASLHNADAIARLDLRIGDHVIVEKAGEIVPQVVGVDLVQRAPGSTPYRFPERCPACRTPVSRKGSSLGPDENEGTPSDSETRCPNESCAAQVRARLEHFAASVEIKGLGPASIATLVEHGLVRDAADLYDLRREQVLGLPRFGEKSASALLAAIDRSRRAPLWRLLRGLGIPRLGTTGARTLAAQCTHLGALSQMDEDELSRALGPATARALLVWLSEPRHRRLCERLADTRARDRPAAER